MLSSFIWAVLPKSSTTWHSRPSPNSGSHVLRRQTDLLYDKIKQLPEMAELRRLTLFAALLYSSGLGLAQSSESGGGSSSSSSSSRTKILQTTNYIDTIDGYSSLSSCALEVLSTVVRGEFSGCGNVANELTSYTCFCTDSYSFMSNVISTDVIESCNGGSTASALATSALVVFDEYCALGVEAGLEPTSECRSSLRQMGCPSCAGRRAQAICQLTSFDIKQPATQIPPPRQAQQAPRPHQHKRRTPKPPPTQQGPPPSPPASWSPSS